MNKKITYLVLLLVIILGVSGCNNKSAAQYSKNITTSSFVFSATKPKITNTSSKPKTTVEEKTNIVEEQSDNTFIQSSAPSNKKSATTQKISPTLKTENNELTSKQATIANTENKEKAPSKKPQNETTPSQTQSTQTHPIFEGEIGNYKTENLPSVSSFSASSCPAWISVYSIGKSSATENEIKMKFKDAFGYEPTEKVVCTYLGKYVVPDYDDAQFIYEYSIKDLTYPLLIDDFYVITKKICTDGSPWVGFTVPGTLETVDTTSEFIKKLLIEMNDTFCDWSGYSFEYLIANRDTLFSVNYFSVAGKMRTKDGKVVDVIYRYTRGNNAPFNK